MIEWKKVHEHLSQLEQKFEQQRSVDSIKQILQTRMHALAAPAPSDDEQHDSSKFVVFQLQQQKYALSAAFVAEVLPITELTEVPCTPGFVAGVINLRGEIVSVLDFVTLFQLPLSGISDLRCLLLLDNRNMRFAVLVEDITGYVAADSKSIKSMQPSISGKLSDFCSGVLGDITVLNAEKLLADKSLIVEQYY